MSENSPALTALDSRGTGQSSTQSPAPTTSSTSEGKGKGKTGRPNGWTPSRQRELSRLYLYSLLPPDDIPKALKEDGWLPGKVSAGKTVRDLLDHDPRWLRPKTREEMDERILALSECKAQRKLRRKPSGPQGLETLQPFDTMPSIAELSDTPIDDLLRFAPEEPLKSISYPPAVDNMEEHSSTGSDESESRKGSSGSEEPSTQTLRHLSIDARSLSTYISTTSLRKRLSKYSTTYVKAIARLMKAHSISDSSAATTTGPAYTVSLHTASSIYTTDSSTTGTRTIRSSSSKNVSTQLHRPALADVFLTLDRRIQRQGVCFPGLKNHDSKMCWCAVADAAEDRNCNGLWLSRFGLLKSPDLDRRFRDRFGNTLLHILAAREADIRAIVNALELGVDGNAKNAAGQNFLHVLPRRYLRTLTHNDWNGLMWVLQKFNRFKIRFHNRDLFGRNFFHLLTHRGKVLGGNELQVLKFLEIQLLPQRDAFGWVPMINLEDMTHLPDKGLRVKRSQEPSWPTVSYAEPPANERRPMVEKGSLASAFLEHKAMSLLPEDQDFIFTHARLIELARNAFITPTIEDLQGRNGLQCLAEASLSLSIHDPSVLRRSHHKRKRNQSGPSRSGERLNLRYQLFESLIDAGVELNHYDKHGYNVLMAFVIHLPDGEDDKTVALLLNHIIHSGANLHWRNREGETALHIAVRLGRKVATQVLLENGANVHARTPEGKGVLALGEVHYFKAKADPSLYASIHACMGLAVKYGAKASPTLVQEWLMNYEFHSMTDWVDGASWGWLPPLGKNGDGVDGLPRIERKFPIIAEPESDEYFAV